MHSEGARHLIVGTAGHVDHGKTTLIKAITGVDTDRLKEEKERGMTIDLGFASLALPDGTTAGIVDVPGHERFLKNMLAGATGVDVVLLVIAADEGVMPQTREHLEILELLDAGAGIVALTKCDMVDPDWLGLVEDDVRAALKPTFLADAPVLRVSSTTGEGVPELVQALEALLRQTAARSSSGPFRIPVDRVFTMTGFGTVVTGTLVSGTMRVGDTVRILPEGLDTRVRQIQVHGKKADEAGAGSRVAVNLVGVETEGLARGSVLAPPGYLSPSARADALVRLLPGAPKPLRSRTRVRLHIGTAEHIGRVVVLGSAEIAPNAEGYIQFVSETPLVAARGDRFVIRAYSPMRTIGGGVVLDAAAHRHRATDVSVLKALDRRRQGDPSDILEDALLAAVGPLTPKDAAARTGLSESDVATHAASLQGEGRAIGLEGGRLVAPAVLAALRSRILTSLESYHSANPVKSGMPREDLRTTSAKGLDTKAFQAVLTLIEQAGEVASAEHLVRLLTHTVRLTAEQQQLAGVLEAAYRDSGLNAPTTDEALAQTRAPRELLHYLIETGALVMIEQGLVLHRDVMDRLREMLAERLSDGSSITVSEFRDLAGSSRKYVVPILEYFDSQRVTRRQGDARVLVRKTGP